MPEPLVKFHVLSLLSPVYALPEGKNENMESVLRLSAILVLMAVSRGLDPKVVFRTDLS